MTKGTSARLDTLDVADASGWHVDSTADNDVMTKGRIRIEVQYSADDAIERAVKHGENGALDTIGSHTKAKVEQLRSWLTGRPVAYSEPLPEADFTTVSGGWTRREFIAAVTDLHDRVFLLRFLHLMDANGQLPAEGRHSRLLFGKRPGGAVFVYPFGRRFPPFKFSIKNGRLMISGCWKCNFKVSGHPGFAEIASILGQDEKGPARTVPVAGMDPDKLWEVGDRVSRAVN